MSKSEVEALKRERAWRTYLRIYLNLWRDAFATGDWFQRLLARLTILALHTGLILLIIMIYGAVHRVL